MAETAKELVALAKRAAHEALPMLTGFEFTLVAFDGAWGFDLRAAGDDIMRADLTPENVASEDTLARALLASRITVRPHPIFSGVVADLDARHAPGSFLKPTEDEARNGLLDHILAGVTK